MSTTALAPSHPHYSRLLPDGRPHVAKIHAEAVALAQKGLAYRRERGEDCEGLYAGILRNNLTRTWIRANEQAAEYCFEQTGGDVEAARFAADMIDDTRRSRAAHAAIGGR